jgi:hypothetical protein
MSRYAEADDGGTLVPAADVMMQPTLIVWISHRAQHFI